MKDEEYLSPLERAALYQKRYRRWKTMQLIGNIFVLLLIIGLLIIGHLKGFI